MRRDVFIENDSGGFSVLAAAAAGDVVEDERQDDKRFVESHQALLLELYGDDSLPVRVVIAEPLRPDEEAQWLARASARIDAPDGRLLVMGGFDPDVLGAWLEQHGPDADGRGVAVVNAAPGSHRVDVYAHVGSMNGRRILHENDERPGAFFRRSHPGRAFPLWLAKMLDLSGEDDPGHEELWTRARDSVKSGSLEVDVAPASVVGFLVHVTPWAGATDEPGPDGWIARDAGRRVPPVFPVGLPADVSDPDLASYLDRLLDRPRPKEELPVARELVPVIEAWSGGPLEAVRGGERPLPLAEAFHLYWLAGLASDSPPRFELRVAVAGPWTPPAPAAEFAVVAQDNTTWALGPPPNAVAWLLWWGARLAAQALEGVPDGSTVDLAMTPRNADDAANPEVGRMRYSGSVRGGIWHIAEASPALALETLDAALQFGRDLVGGRITLRGAEERRVLEAETALQFLEESSLVWEGESVRLAEPDERTSLLLAAPVFRTRFGAQWATDPVGADADDE